MFRRSLRTKCFLQAPALQLLKGRSVTDGSKEKSNSEVKEREEEGWTEGSLKAQCVRENRSVPSPRQPTAQAH